MLLKDGKDPGNAIKVDEGYPKKSIPGRDALH
jgi:hypothetical protein